MLGVPHQSLADPAGASSLVAAVAWLQGTLLGTISTTIAIIAVAATGILVLSGRIDVRRGLSVVVGCFILFGASSIAAGIQSTAAPSAMDSAPPAFQPSPAVATSPPIVRQPPLPYDPYAGASVPPS